METAPRPGTAPRRGSNPPAKPTPDPAILLRSARRRSLRLAMGSDDFLPRRYRRLPRLVRGSPARGVVAVGGAPRQPGGDHGAALSEPLPDPRPRPHRGPCRTDHRLFRVRLHGRLVRRRMVVGPSEPAPDPAGVAGRERCRLPHLHPPRELSSRWPSASSSWPPSPTPFARP